MRQYPPVSPGTAALRIAISPDRVLRWLVWGIVLLTVLGIAGELSRNFDATDGDALPRSLRVIRRNFNPSAEQTVGTWFTASMLLCAGLLVAAISLVSRAARDRFARHWHGLAIILAFLACDEGASLHEQLGDWVRDIMPTGGPLLWAWVVPYSIFAAVVGLAYLSFLRALPPDSRRRFVLAAAIYIGGALIIEMIEAGITDARSRGGGPVSVLAVIEETAEMAGMAYLIFALLHHIAAHTPIALIVAGDPSPTLSNAPAPRSNRTNPYRLTTVHTPSSSRNPHCSSRIATADNIADPTTFRSTYANPDADIRPNRFPTNATRINTDPPKETTCSTSLSPSPPQPAGLSPTRL